MRGSALSKRSPYPLHRGAAAARRGRGQPWNPQASDAECVSRRHDAPRVLFDFCSPTNGVVVVRCAREVPKADAHVFETMARRGGQRPRGLGEHEQGGWCVGVVPWSCGCWRA